MEISGSLLGRLCGAVAAAAAGLLAMAILRHNLRIRRVRRAYQCLPDNVKEQVRRPDAKSETSTKRSAPSAASRCASCSNSVEIIPGVQMADAGVGYVYGCDAHPGRCKGFMDSH